MLKSAAQSRAAAVYPIFQLTMRRIRNWIGLTASLSLAACSGGANQWPAQQWRDVSLFVETRPEPPAVGMTEFLVMAATDKRRVAHDLVVSIRLSNEDPWRQLIQDGHSGVYRRALRIPSAGPHTLLVRIQRRGEEGLLQFDFTASGASGTD